MASGPESPTLQEVPLEQLHSTFDPADIDELSRWQMEQSAGNTPVLLQTPVSTDFVKKYGDRSSLITHNQAMYADELEDIMFEDVVYAALLRLPKPLNENHDKEAAIRARRSVVAFWLTNEKVVSLPLPNEPEEQPA